MTTLNDSRCEIRGTSSRMCELGTKSCITIHSQHSPKAKVSGEWRIEKEGGLLYFRYDGNRMYFRFEDESDLMLIADAHNQSLALVTARAEAVERKLDNAGREWLELCKDKETLTSHLSALRSENQKLREALEKDAVALKMIRDFWQTKHQPHTEQRCLLDAIESNKTALAKPQPSQAAPEPGDVTA